MPAMTTCVALLRAVNVGGANRVTMPDLRALAAGLGFGDPRTLLQTGNLVFETEQCGSATLEAALERAIAEELRLRIDVIVRSASEWTAILERNPFAAEAERDPAHLVLMLLKTAPEPNAVDDLRGVLAGPERLHAGCRELYIVYPAGIGRSKLTGTLIEGKLRTRGTGRNWNSVQKLSAMLRDADASDAGR